MTNRIVSVDDSFSLPTIVRNKLKDDLSGAFVMSADGETFTWDGEEVSLGGGGAVDPGDFATAEQGEKADTAVQPAALASGLAGKQDTDPALDDLSGADVEAWGRSWLDLASQAAARTRLGLGTAATMSPVQVVTDSAAQASLSSTFVMSADGETFTWNDEEVSLGGGGTIQHVRWTGSTWPARPPDAEFVIFVSTHDPAAVAPTDINLAQGDYWLRAPEVG